MAKKKSSSKKEKTNQEQAIELIGQACELLGWQVIVPNTDDPVPFIIMGTPDMVGEISGILEDAEFLDPIDPEADEVVHDLVEGFPSGSDDDEGRGNLQ